MFNTINLRAGDQHHHHRAEVHEHRAPTDESVKLLREMEKAALDRVLSTIHLEDAPVKCVVVHQRSILDDRDEFIMRYMMGGNVYDVRHEFRRPWSVANKQDTLEKCVDELRDALAKHIATVLLAPSFRRIAAEIR